MLVYEIDSNGNFLNIYECQPCPVTGGWLYPTFYTETPPPDGDFISLKFINNAWITEKKVYIYNKETKEKLSISEFDIIDDMYTTIAPLFLEFEQWDAEQNKWVVSIEKIKEFQKQKVYYSCEAEMSTNNKGIISQAIDAKIDCRNIDTLRLSQWLILLNSEGATDNTKVDYILYNNSVKEVTVAQVKTAQLEIIQELTAMQYKKHSLYAEIDAASSKEEILSIVWSW